MPSSPGTTVKLAPSSFGCRGPFLTLAGFMLLQPPFFACFSGAASPWSIYRFRLSSFFSLLCSLSGSPLFGFAMLLVWGFRWCFLVFLPLCCARLSGWVPLFVSCLSSVCRPPFCLFSLHCCYSNAVGAALSALVLLCLPGFPPCLFGLSWFGFCPLSSWFGFCSSACHCLSSYWPPPRSYCGLRPSVIAN